MRYDRLVRSIICVVSLLIPTFAHALDEDFNGLSDLWQWYYFGNASGILANDDPDGDTRSNSHEMAFGSNPQDNQSVDPLLTLIPNAGTLDYEFPSNLGIRYQLQQSTTLQTWTNGAILTGTGLTLAGSVPAANPKHFLRLIALPPLDNDSDNLNARDEALFGSSDLTANSDTDDATDLEEFRLKKRGIQVDPTKEYTIPGTRDGEGDFDDDGYEDLIELRYGSDPIVFTSTPEAIDIDADTLPDAWEDQYFDTLDQTAEDNFDNDPLLNGQEKILSTNPTVVMTDGSRKDGHGDFDQDQIIDVWELEDGTDPKSSTSSTNKKNYVAATIRIERRAAWGALSNPGNLPLETLYPSYMNGTRFTLEAIGYETADQNLTTFGNKRGVIAEVNTTTTAFRFSGAGSTFIGYYANQLIFLRKGVKYKATFSTTNPNLPFVSAKVTWTPVGIGFPNSTLNDDAPDDRLIFNEVTGRQTYYTNSTGQLLVQATTVTPDPDPHLTIFTLKGTSSVFNGPGGSATNFSTGFVNLIPDEVVSRDKFMAGAIDIPDGRESLEMEFVGPGGENLGKYGQLLGGGSTKVYEAVTEILSEDDINSGGQPSTQKVWFVKDANNDRRINYYTCFNSVGPVEIKLYLNGSSTVWGKITHELTFAQDFADTIAYVDAWVKGTSFYMPDPPALPTAAPLTQVQSSPGNGEIDNLTRACLIPFFSVINQVEGVSSIAIGIFDGAKGGIQDDWAFLQLIGQAGVAAGDWAVQQASAELLLWKNSPLKRAGELKQLADKVCEDLVFKPLQQLDEDLSTWQGFIFRAWRTYRSIRGSQRVAYTVTKSAWDSVANGLLEWADDFCARMMTGSELAHWNNAPWAEDRLLASINSETRLVSYTFGFTFGYISEQIAIGALSGGVLKLGQVAAKGGITLSANLAKRTAANLAARAHFLKRMLAETTELPVDLVAAYQRGFSVASTGPVGEGMIRVPMEMAQEGVGAGKLVWREYITDYFAPNVRQFVKQGGGHIIERQFGRLMHILGDDFSEEIGHNFLKVADEFILVRQADGTVDDFFEAFFKAMEGNPSLVKGADDVAVKVGGTSEPLSANAKARLKQFLSDPEPGNPWKLDTPDDFPDESQFPIPSNYWARGLLVELQQFKKVYKSKGYTHYPNAAGYDYKGPKWVQMKSVANPNTAGAISRMEKAITKLAEEASKVTEGGDTAKMILHVVTKDADNGTLALALDSFRRSQPYASRIEILIERVVYP